MKINLSFTVHKHLAEDFTKKQIKASTVEIHHPAEAHHGSRSNSDDRDDAESVTQ